MNTQRKISLNREEPPVSQAVPDEVCQALSAILSDGADVHRCLAAQALGRIGAPTAVQPLIAALLDEDEDVRTDVAEALSELADPRASQQLLENLLGDPCTEVKLAAIETLAKLGDKKVIPWLRRMVKGRDEEIVWDEEEFFASGWDDWVDLQIKAVDALAVLNAGEAVSDIVAAMRDEDAQDMTEAAFNALARMGDTGIEALACFLDDESTRLRRRAAAALAASDAREAAEPVTRALADPSAEVRLAAMRALASQVPADERLVALLEDSDAAVRAETARLCGGYNLDRIGALLDDASIAVQVAALTVLADSQDFSADKALDKALCAKLVDNTAEIAAAAARALAAVAPQAAVDHLIPLLGDADRSVDARLGMLHGLAAAGGERAVEALAGVIDDEARAIRLEAMSALARLAGADAVWPNAAGGALLSALRGVYEPEAGDDTVAAPEDLPAENSEPGPAAADEGEEEGGEFPTSTLGAILEDVPEVREALRLSGDGLELTPDDMERLALAKRIKSKKRVPLAPKVVLHEDIRRFAARVLGDLKQADVARELAIALTADDHEVRLAAADSLARIGAHLNPLPGDVAEALMGSVETADRDLKLLLIRALAGCQGDGIGDMLRARLGDDDPFVRSEAVRALSRLGQVGAEVEPLLGDDDASVRLSAAEAIAAAGGADAVKLLVDFAFSFEGYHGRQTARLLRDLDGPGASALFVDVLRDTERKRTWSVAIGALEELNRS
ncbi:MAG: HEAT repeat domain-containing protein [Rhodospirillales bacterium]|nr:HEAT repeat domain-containing protein [Rhodospirillales bacterium]